MPNHGGWRPLLTWSSRPSPVPVPMPALASRPRASPASRRRGAARLGVQHAARPSVLPAASRELDAAGRGASISRSSCRCLIATRRHPAPPSGTLWPCRRRACGTTVRASTTTSRRGLSRRIANTGAPGKRSAAARCSRRCPSHLRRLGLGASDPHGHATSTSSAGQFVDSPPTPARRIPAGISTALADRPHCVRSTRIISPGGCSMVFTLPLSRARSQQCRVGRP